MAVPRPPARRAQAPSGVLTIDNESGGTWTCDFNPFNLSYISFSLGNVYEPLMFVNTLQSGKASPWLATSCAWSNGNKTLTFTIRKGVKFTNGDPLTPADVVYTFNLLKKYQTLDINSFWSALSSVTQSGDQVVMTFKTVGGAVLLLHRRPGRDRGPEGLVEDRQPGDLPGQEPGRHRRVRR